MQTDNLALYGMPYYVLVNEPSDELFYFFDYDVRSAAINMEFQHFHAFHELFIPLAAETACVIEGEYFELQPFDIVAIPPNVLHKSYYGTNVPSKRLVIQFNLPLNIPGLANEHEQLLNVFDRKKPVFRGSGELQERLFCLLNDIFASAQKGDAMRNLEVHIRFIEFLTLLFQNQGENSYSSCIVQSPLEKTVYSVTAYIHSHYMDELSLEFLAWKFEISPCYLSHQFKKITGFTLTNYIQMTRVRNVQSMLANTQTPITDIAESCGFLSFSQFNRVFKKHSGISPTQYRKENQSHHWEHHGM